MGLGSLSAIYLDSCLLVLALEGAGLTAKPARRLVESLKSMPGIAATSELTIAEVLAPTKSDQVMSVDERTRMYLGLFETGLINLFPITRGVLLGTVGLRKSYPQRIPDAIHITTALQPGSRSFVSFDRDARRVPASLAWTVPTEDQIDKLLGEFDA